jgi:hypothetical protein
MANIPDGNAINEELNKVNKPVHAQRKKKVREVKKTKERKVSATHQKCAVLDGFFCSPLL